MKATVVTTVTLKRTFEYDDAQIKEAKDAEGRATAKVQAHLRAVPPAYKIESIAHETTLVEEPAPEEPAPVE